MSVSGYGADIYGEGVYGLLGVAGGDVVILDPLEVAEGRIPLPLTSGEIRIQEDGPDWGEAAIEAFMAELETGQVPADYRVPNRQIRIPLLLGAIGVDFEVNRAKLQQKVGLFQREGGWVKRNNLYADVVNASLAMPDKWGWQNVEPDVILVLDALPDFFGDEIELPIKVETTNPTVISTHTGILGDWPGRCSVVLTEFGGDIQRGLVWGWRSRHYSAADTAQLRYRAQDMTALDTAAVVAAPVPTESGQMVRHPGTHRFVSPIVGTDIADGPLTHTGSYRVLARVHTASPLALLPDNVQVRLAWDVGDYTSPTENDWWTIPGYGNFYVADLGEVYLEAAPVGEHRWAGQAQGRTLSGGRADISVDELWFCPTDEGSGRLRASVADATGAFADYTALGLSDFSETAGVLNGKSMLTGGSWATSSSAGSFDFTVVTDATGSYASRFATSDTSDDGRLALAGTGTAGQLTNQVLFQWWGVDGPTPVVSLYQRWGADTANLHVRYFHEAGTAFVYLYKRTGGGFTEVGRALAPVVGLESQTGFLRMATDSAGSVFVWVGHHGENFGDPVLVASHADLATGGALAAGRHGFRDFYTAATPAVTRFFSWYAAWVGEADAVMFPNRAVEIRTDGVFRESVEATRYGPIQGVEGDLPRIPVAGLEGRTSELFVKASRGDFGELPDSGVDNIISTIRYRPAWIFPR